VTLTTQHAHDGVRDVVRTRDGESDQVDCDFADRRDTLLLDGLDLPLARSWRCFGIARSSPPRAVPVVVESPLLRSDQCCPGTWVRVACPLDTSKPCRGSASARVGGRRVGSASFVVSPGRTRAVRVSRSEYFDPDCEDDVPAIGVARTRMRGRVLVVARRSLILACEDGGD
jgi:hypothetical protein